MTLEELGYNKNFEAFRIEQKLNDFEPGRIIAEHKERYTVKTTQGEIAKVLNFVASRVN
jgi:ribosome biogenesis GTPase